MFLSRNKKTNVYPCKPQFYYIKWGLRGSKLYRRVFVMNLFRAAGIVRLDIDMLLSARPEDEYKDVRGLIL